MVINTTPIEWTDATWNPMTGCTRRCHYCYAKKLAEGRLRGRFGYPQNDPFAPTFHIDRLNEPMKRKKPTKIFVCDMGDLFNVDVPTKWITRIMSVVRDCPQHTFQFLTKHPNGLLKWVFPSNAWAGITIDEQGRAYTVGVLRSVKAPVRFISFEPLLEPITLNLKGVQWIIIGAKTGKDPFQPEPKWVQYLIDQAMALGIAVFLKDNLKWKEKIQQFPRNSHGE